MHAKTWLVWCALVVGGTVLLALPDDDVRVFTISRTHGPAALDAVGAVFVLVAWVILLRGVWLRRSRLPRNATWWAAIGVSLVGGLALVAWSVLSDHGRWWLLGIAFAGGAQVLIALAVSVRHGRSPKTLDGDAGEPAAASATYRRFALIAGAAFVLVAAYTIAFKMPSGELRSDWLHTALHLLTAIAALAVSRASVSRVWPRAFTWALLAVYGALGALGWFVDGLFMGTPLRVPLGSADNVFHLLLAAGAVMAVLLALRPGQHVRRASRLPRTRGPTSPR